MPSVSEILADPSDGLPIHDALSAGVDVLSGSQEVSFIPYVRVVLPLDGFVFWMNASLLTPAELAQHNLESAGPITVTGSLHYATIGTQVEDETIGIRRVDFTAEQPVKAFAEATSTVIYVGTWETYLGSFKFTFSQSSSFYEQASIYHYVGDAVYPVFERQLIESLADFDKRQIVSNSLPIWLSLINAVPFPSLVNQRLDLYPAFLVPANLVPPYAAIEIPPASTRALQMAPRYSRSLSRSQLVFERVNLTIYGLRNDEVMDFLDYVVTYSDNTDIFGITNTPVVQDDHRTQIELGALAQKKRIEFEINYYQSRVRDIARQVIADAGIVMIPSDSTVPPPFIRL